MKIVGFQELSFDQVEKGHTSLFSAFKFSFHSWLQVTIEFTTDWAAASTSSLFTGCGEDRDIGRESNNCIVVEYGDEIVNVEQEKQRSKNGTLR